MPRFPTEATLSDNVRDLYRSRRRSSTHVDAGLTSIGLGEGSTDVLDGSGNPVARLGDGPNGIQGFLVPDGAGGWRTVQADAAAQVAVERLAREQAVAAEASARQAAIAAEAQARQDADAAEASARASAIAAEASLRQSGDAATLASAKAYADGLASGTSGSISTLTTRVNQLSTTVGDHTTAISQLLSDLQDVIHWLDTHYGGWRTN